ncbi:MAG: T9SS type A sorting domain-containing protein [Flavobacteriaceae bacterium]
MKKITPYFLITVVLLLLDNNALFAQTGPGGVGNSTSNILWLKSEDISSLLDGDDITSWIDASGNSNDVSQPASSFTPVYKTSILNGFPAVRFEKTNGRLRRNSFTTFPTSAITAIYVNSNTDSNDGVLSYATGASNNDFLLFSSNNLRFYRGGSNISTGVSFNDGSFHITNASRNSVGGSVEMWKDGSRDFTGTLSSGTSITSGGTLAIAGEQDSVDGNYDAAQAHFGDFTEVMIFNTVLNEAQNIIVANYLAAKYNLVISNDRYAYETTHSNDVAGIGREDVSNTHLAAMSDNILQIENASGINADQEYLLFGHDDGDVTTSWTTTEAPEAGVNIQRLAREWRLDETGDVGTIDFIVDVATFPTLPVDHTMYALLIDSDGDFSSGASVYEMTLDSGTEYTVTGIDFTDGDYIAIAAVDPTIQHTLTSGSGAESIDATIEISINFIPSTSRTVEYTTANVSATAGSDYTAATGVVATITAGNTTTNYTITITDDPDPESTETFTSTLSNPSAGLNLGANTVFTYSISDNDISRKVYFDVETANGNEDISPVTVNLSIDVADPVNPTSVDYAVTSGTATGGGTDYTLASGTVTFAATTTTGSFTFTVNDDMLKESNETFTVTLSNPVNCNLDNTMPFAGTGFTTYTYTINDDDANPEIQFTSTSSSGLESVSPVNFEVNLSTISGIDASANYTVTGTATGGGFDYTLADGTLTIPAGSTTANITAVITGDSEVEISETIIITLSSPTDATLGTNTVHTYTINDDDSFGYTGPGGVGDSDTNIVWLDANEITGVSNGADLTSWSDVSGNNNDFSETATFSPVYQTNVVNGFPVARFNKTNNRIRNPSFTDFATDAITSIFVNINNGESTDAHLSYASSAGNNDFLIFSSNNLQFFRGTSTTSGVSSNDNNWHIINTSWQSSGGNLAIWKDGLESFTSTFQAGTSITTGGSLAIAGEQDAVDGSYDAAQSHTGDYPEVIVYNVYLNDAQQIIVSNYLSAKYDISISNDFYTQDDGANGDYDFNVAGIGQASDGSFHFDSQGNGIVRMYNPSSLANNDYLFWGRNNTTAYLFATNNSNYQERINSNWRVSKQNDVGTVTVEIDFTGIDISGKQSCADFMLVVDNDSDLLSPTNSYALTNTAGNIYQATGVSFTDGDYFTIEFQDKIVVDGTQFYNGSGASNVPNTTDSCYKLLVTSAADGTIPLTENADVREVEVESGGNLVVNTEIRLQVTNEINNSGDIRMIGTSQLLQTHTGTAQVTGTGELYIDQEGTSTTVYQSGFWSSPVTSDGSNFTLSSILKDGTTVTSAVSNPLDINFTSVDILDGAKTTPITISGRWLANLVNDTGFTTQISPTGESFSPPEAWNMKSTGGGTQNFTFKGVINDGTYTSVIDENRLSLIGNPYPSAIDADQFISDNSSVIIGTLYFYDGTNDVTHAQGEYAGGYATRVSGVGTPFGAGATPSQYIPVGQGFFVARTASGSGTITFQNSQRFFQTIGGTNFFNRTSEESNNIQVIRIGFQFELDNSDMYKRQLAIAFRGLTNNYEEGFDAQMFDRHASDLALKLDDRTEPFVISSIDYQDEDMRIPLELFLDENRDVTFNLDAIENMSATVYLEDSVDNVHYNLSDDGAVTLSLPIGDYTDRFFISFINRSVLKTDDFSISSDFSIFYNGNLEEMKVQRRNDGQVLGVKIYNILGQEVETQEFSNTLQNEFSINVSHLSSALYIVKLYTNKGVFSKKLIITK